MPGEGGVCAGVEEALVEVALLAVLALLLDGAGVEVLAAGVLAGAGVLAAAGVLAGASDPAVSFFFLDFFVDVSAV